MFASLLRLPQGCDTLYNKWLVIRPSSPSTSFLSREDPTCTLSLPRPQQPGLGGLVEDGLLAHLSLPLQRLFTFLEIFMGLTRYV